MPGENLYREFWRASVRNLLLGSAISLLPASAFYYVAFSYTERQVKVLLLIAPIMIGVFLLVDLSLNRLYLAPVRALAQTGQASGEVIAAAYRRLHNFPLFSFARVFCPHAVSATAAGNLLILYANAHWALGIPAHDFWIYWLLNLTVMPIGHGVYEYHANARAARDALRRLLERTDATADIAGLKRVPLAVRVAVLYALLGISPLFFLGVAANLRGTSSALGVGWSSLGILVAGAGVLNLLLLLLFAREVAEQTQNLLGGFAKVESGELDVEVDAFSPDEFGRIAWGVNKMIQGLRERQRFRDLFGQYMSVEVCQAILDGKVNLEGETCEASVLFCDIRGFTAYTAGRPPADSVKLLNRFFARMAEAVTRHGGTINKFLGDGFLAVFGAPVHFADHAGRGIQAALEMERQLAEFNREQKELGGQPLEIGVGIDSGIILAGNVGSESKIEYAVIGDAVNRASRIEQLNKQLGTRILISQSTHRAAGYEPVRLLPPLPVRGFTEPMVVAAIGERRNQICADPLAACASA